MLNLVPQETLRVAPKTYLNLIAGRWVPSRTGKTFLNINPARQDDGAVENLADNFLHGSVNTADAGAAGGVRLARRAPTCWHRR